METLHQSKDIIQHYRIIEVLGQGGVGITYLAEDTKTGCKVALKALSLRSSKDWKQMELFEREARILKQLNHPAIPRYIDYFAVDTPEDQTLYIVQEWAVGKSLADLVKQGWRTNEAGVRKIAIQVLEILVYLHSLEPAVIHRDIKPHNLVMSEDGKVSLVDFGAVQDTYYNTFMRGSTMVGTYGYMAPEQFRGQAVPATDLFALGATLLFLLTHRHPADLPHDRLRINFRSHLQVSDTFADWLEKMLEPDTDDRFSSAQTALSILKGQLAIFRGKTIRPIKALVMGTLTIASLSVLNSYKYIVLFALPLEFSSSLTNFRYTVIENAIVERGDIGAIKAAQLKFGFHNSSSWLHAAETKEVAERMIQAGVPVNSELGGSPLATAAAKGRIDIVQLLIERGAEVNSDSSLETAVSPLEAAVREGHKDIAELLIQHGAEVNREGNNRRDSPLHAAIFTKQLDIVKLLLVNGANVNDYTYWGTPLHVAVGQGDVNSVKFLIQYGANVNAKTTYEHYPPGYTPLHYAAKMLNSGSIEIVKLLLKHGANVNTEDTNGETPLHEAVSANNPELVELLLKHGAKTNIKDKSGETPLDYALSNRNERIDYASFNRNERIVKLLKKHGAEK